MLASNKSMKGKLEIINNLIDKSKKDQLGFNPQNILIHSIYFTINFNDLVNLYIHTENPDIRQTLNYHLSKRIKDKNINKKVLYNKLFRIIKKMPYNQHQKIRFLLSNFIKELPKKYIQQYYNYFSSTGYAYDLSAALKVSNLVWNIEFDQVYVDKYIETCDVRYLNSVLDNGQSYVIYKNLHEIWDDDYPPDYIKNKILRKISSDHIDKLGFLKESEPDKYLYALAFSSIEIADDVIIELYEKLNNTQKSFGLWCIGKIGKWNILRKYIKEYIR